MLAIAFAAGTIAGDWWAQTAADATAHVEIARARLEAQRIINSAERARERYLERCFGARTTPRDAQ